jgi:hypothetical protein
VSSLDGTATYNRSLDQVQLDLVSFPLEKCPSYTAISYTWGYPDRNHTIQVLNKTMQITATLHAASSWLLSEKYLWIDQISIKKTWKRKVSKSLSCEVLYLPESEWFIGLAQQRRKSLDGFTLLSV